MLRHPVRALILIGVLIGALVVADRVAAHVAEGKIAAVLQDEANLAHKPTVTAHGFPFVTQAVGGKYRRIEVTARDIFGSTSSGSGSVTRVDFDGVHLSLSEALGGDVRELRIDEVSGVVVVSFADLAAAAPVPGLVVGPVAGRTDQASVSESVSLGGVTVRVGVTVQVTLSGGTITLRAVDVELPGGVELPASVLDQVRSRAAFSVRVPGLPSGVRLTAVTVGQDGVTATLHADHIVLTR